MNVVIESFGTYGEIWERPCNFRPREGDVLNQQKIGIKQNVQCSSSKVAECVCWENYVHLTIFLEL